MTAAKQAKAKDEATADNGGSKSPLGRTVIYSHCSAVGDDDTKKLEHSNESAGVVIHANQDGTVNIDCTASNGKRFVVERVPHVEAVKADKNARHCFRFTSR